MEDLDSNVTSTKYKESVFIPSYMNLKIETYPTAKIPFSVQKSIIYYTLGLLLGVFTVVCEGVFASSKYRVIDVLMSIVVYCYSFCTVHGKLFQAM